MGSPAERKGIAQQSQVFRKRFHISRVGIKQVDGDMERFNVMGVGVGARENKKSEN